MKIPNIIQAALSQIRALNYVDFSLIRTYHNKCCWKLYIYSMIVNRSRYAVYISLKVLKLFMLDDDCHCLICVNYHKMKSSRLNRLKLQAFTQRAQMYFKDVLKTSLQDWSSRRVWRHKNVNRPVVLKTYFTGPQDQYSRSLAAQV